MNAFEVNAMLVEAARFDPRMRRVNPVDQADMAQSWARLLADVSPAAAAWALDEHYKTSRESITVADIRTLADAYDDQIEATALTERERADRDAWLRSRGIDPAEFDQLVARGEKPADILAARGITRQELTA